MRINKYKNYKLLIFIFSFLFSIAVVELVLSLFVQQSDSYYGQIFGKNLVPYKFKIPQNFDSLKKDKDKLYKNLTIDGIRWH